MSFWFTRAGKVESLLFLREPFAFGSVIDLRVLRDQWTEEGARQIFEQLVTHCVQTTYPSAQAVRPDPGDEGLDTFVGDFQGELRVWQAKYFCDGVGVSQRRQIRKSWKACLESPRFSRVVSWTLCLPIELSVEEHSWWQSWRKKEAEKHNVDIDLWAQSRFRGFSTQPELRGVFDEALSRGVVHATQPDVLAGMRMKAPRQIVSLPSANHLLTALFVRKLEVAGWLRHRAARTAFYNFELLRSAVEQGGTAQETGSLNDLRERVFSLWEHAYNEHNPDRLGRELIVEVVKRVNDEHARSLRCDLSAGPMHKLGAIHDWADLCEAGWTADYEEVLRAEGDI